MVRSVSSIISEPTPYEDECGQHGHYSGTITVFGRREIKSGCPECAKLAEEARAERDRLEAIAHREQWERSRMEAKLGRAEIPPRFRDKRFDGFMADTDRQKKALTACQSYAESFDTHHQDGRCLMLLGKPGCGKTHLGAAIADHVCKKTRHAAVYRTLPGLVQDIRASYSDQCEYTEADVITAITACGLLILDEIGATKTSEFELALIFNVINTRYESKLPTVIISNLPPAELKNAIGDRCVDRLREGGGIVVGFDWDSKRGTI